ncbi:acyl transferase/acyl hydrolase/lysophospholipase [Fusarium flagelliforme]|uniref:Patatin-like phospholipase domain-containing protein n=1 Tax=Fusarium flagelliforme TaxID=2675880 RepID=A0A395MEI3_9HYPO|nr:acyl transferase/acyl hydrolase/lysophospholipase [Fusarium flagelliforme]KAH7179847.1 acyl transferase/acyl hydrolase/lysophospholipase [Fusarium flagelliforme]RFN46256.1 nte family protein [Fusarium flagelliforme]
MSDLLLQTRAVPSLYNKSTKPPTKSNTKAKRPPVSSVPVVNTLQKAIRQANDTWQWCKDGLTEDQRLKIKQLEERKHNLCLGMQNAETHAQWEAAAKELDSLEGNDEWKRDASTGDYNPELIQERLDALDDARTKCDVHTMMHLIRTALSRDLGGMDNVDLYRHSYSGTKHLIERYVESTIKSIDAVVTQSRLDQSIENRDLLEGILFARQSYGRSALLLSGGGTFGMSHIGVLKALFEAKLLPRIISGASAGSIVCAAMCTRTDEEIPLLIEEFPYGDLAVFEDPSGQDGVWNNLRRLLTEGSWSDIKHLTRVMRGLMGDMTFQEAYNRTRRILNICVSTASMYELPRLLNYVTAPNVMIWSAVAASCSVPLVFNAAPLLVKDPITGEHQPWNPTPQRWIDGSVDNDLPMTRLSEMFNVNHFIVSQVNPHVVPFLAKDDHLSPVRKPEPTQQTAGDQYDWLWTMTSLARDEALHRLHFLAELGIMPNLATKFQSVLSQKYSGDINILPEMGLNDLPRLLRNPSPEFMMRACLMGERATWPKLSRVRDRCAIELALDRAVHRLRARVVFSESQRDLRRLNVTAGNIPLKLPVRIKEGQTIIEPPSEVKNQKRNRRKSGSSLHVAPRHWLLLDPSTITDDETEQEERIEMERRRAGSPVAQRKPPHLKRASRSQVHLRTRATLSAVVDAEEANPTFNFSKPITPPVKSPKGSESQAVSDGSGPTTPEPANTSETVHSGEDTDAETFDVHVTSKALGGAAARAGWILWD